MADHGRLRPINTTLPEYLENPFPEAGTETHALPVPSRLLCPLPAPTSKIDFRVLHINMVDIIFIIL